MKNKKIIRTSQHGFTKKKSRLIIMINFYYETNGLAHEGRAMGIVFLDFSKVFDIVPHKILFKYVLDGQTVRCVESLLNGQAPRVVISGAKPTWRLVASSIHHGIDRTESSPI